jgi:hypothetical protein
MLEQGRHAGRKGNWRRFLRDPDREVPSLTARPTPSELGGCQAFALELQSQALTLHHDLTHFGLDLLRPMQLHTHREQRALKVSEQAWGAAYGPCAHPMIEAVRG